MRLYKVVIVDDEMIVRIGMKSIIRWEDENFTIVGDASNGLEALEVCRATQPDVVLTDIKMPKMDGLTLIEHLRKEMPNTHIVILSCLDEFDVLQHAIRLGVKDYFLKLTLDGEQLKGLMRRLSQELSLLNHTNKGAALPSSSDIDGTVQAEYRQLLMLQTEQLEFPQASNLHGHQQQPLQMVLFLKDYRKDDPDVADGKLRRTSVWNLMREEMGHRFVFDLVDTGDAQLLLVKAQKEQANHELIETVQRMQSNLLRMVKYSTSVAICTAENCQSHFYSEYQQCMQIANVRFFSGQGVFQHYERLLPAPENDLSALWQDEELSIENALEYLDFDSAFNILKDVFPQLKKLNGKVSATALLHRLSDLMAPWYTLYKQFRHSLLEAAPTLKNCNRELDVLETLQDAIHWAENYVSVAEQLCTQAMRLGRTRHEIEQAKQYVEQHYALPITGKDVAESIGFNPSYFSHLYKKETGEGFTEYLTKLRISKAKVLLLETTLSINTIGERVGYSDPAYFRKQFRELYGMSPSEFRRCHEK